MSTVVVTYVCYVALSIGLTVWVARTLSRHGAVFLVDVFDGDTAMATAVNRLLVVGFYLINLGFVSLALTVDRPLDDAAAAIEALSVKMGGVLLVLGAMHFLNLYVFSRIRRRSQLDRMPAPPIPPGGWGWGPGPVAAPAPPR